MKRADPGRSKPCRLQANRHRRPSNCIRGWRASARPCGWKRRKLHRRRWLAPTAWAVRQRRHPLAPVRQRANPAESPGHVDAAGSRRHKRKLSGQLEASRAVRGKGTGASRTTLSTEGRMALAEPGRRGSTSACWPRAPPSAADEPHGSEVAPDTSAGGRPRRAARKQARACILRGVRATQLLTGAGRRTTMEWRERRDLNPRPPA